MQNRFIELLSVALSRDPPPHPHPHPPPGCMLGCCMTGRCLFSFPVDIPVGWKETEEEHNFKLPHLHRCHGLIEGWREFCWKAEVQSISNISCSFTQMQQRRVVHGNVWGFSSSPWLYFTGPIWWGLSLLYSTMLWIQKELFQTCQMHDRS